MTQAEALQILKTGANVFLTGEPGAGKTHTINEYTAYLKSCGVEASITASTGIAATHIGGMTIHSWSGIGIAKWLDQYTLDRITSNERTIKRLRYARVLIIDEVSMLSPETLSMVDAVCREVRQHGDAFGGLQVILVGDFFQLPPVQRDAGNPAVQQELITNAPARFAYESPAWKRLNPVVCYLTEQHRQNDRHFLAFLSAMRANELTDQDRLLISTRLVDGTKAPEDAPKLFTHNANVDAVNEQELAKINGEAREFVMQTHGIAPLVEVLKKGCLSPEKLLLKVGAAVMFTKNNIANGFVNGTLGVVEGFAPTGDPEVRVRDGRLVLASRVEWNLQEGRTVLAQISQVPLRLAWAITVHKSQGMSLDAAVMDLSKVFEYGQGYVAISRVRSLAGVHLLGLNERALQMHPQVLVQDTDFRLASEAAALAFGKLSSDELSSMNAHFISACGGMAPEPVVARVTKPKKKKRASSKA